MSSLRTSRAATRLLFLLLAALILAGCELTRLPPQTLPDEPPAPAPTAPAPSPSEVAPAPSDPAPAPSEPAPSAPPHQHGDMPFIDVNAIPAGSSGSAERLVREADDAPNPSDGTGAFRTVCEFSHMNFDDPLVYPGQPGKAHLHMYFGNTAVDAFSTQESIETTGNGTCRGGIANRSAYWVPAMIDTRTGTPVRPAAQNHFYYKTGYEGVPPADIQPLPAGLRMIAGDAMATEPQGQAVRWSCLNGADGDGTTIPNCAVGDELGLEVFFPQCWDGENLDSANHKSHMAYPEGGSCPASHPVPLPKITFNIRWLVEEQDAPQHWRLSSDPSSVPAGYSAHGDWVNGWEQELVETWTRLCLNPAVDCFSNLLGDGREIYGAV